MDEACCSNGTHRGLAWLVSELDAHGKVVDEPTARRLLSQADLSPEEVAGYIEPRAESYARRCVVRRENYEVLVLTWSPWQGSVAHDHSGSLCGLKVVQGTMTEQLYEDSLDGRVRRTVASRLGPGEITVDPGVVVHSLANGAPGEALVTVHIYSPPLPEVRRYAVTDSPPARAFVRAPHPAAKTVAIVGGGFTGLMALANLLRFGNGAATPMHIVVIDAQAAIGEGVAYRTNDARHLLNVPAGRMSAWPDFPDDFLAFARARDGSVGTGDFLPRKLYGQYVRDTMLKMAEAAGEHLSVEIVRDEVARLAPLKSSGWSIATTNGRTVRADQVILAVGHRPPNDPLTRAWKGPRTRFVADPWAALVLSQIGPDEPVLLIGSGLTAVDVILTLNRSDRSAPLIAISRRGLSPLAHQRQAKPPCNLTSLLEHWLDPALHLSAGSLVASLRRRMEAECQSGVEWQQVIDALRPAIPQLWSRLEPAERARFLRHVRPFWEIHRHRTAPAVADTLDAMRLKGKLEICAGSLVSAIADADGIDVQFSCRSGASTRKVRVAWVVNCTGPGAHNRHETHPFLRPLLADGTLHNDELDLGLMTDDTGRAMRANGELHDDLLIAGTLRKATLWESTAVPELRNQAQTVAHAVVERLAAREPQHAVAR